MVQSFKGRSDSRTFFNFCKELKEDAFLSRWSEKDFLGKLPFYLDAKSRNICAVIMRENGNIKFVDFVYLLGQKVTSYADIAAASKLNRLDVSVEDKLEMARAFNNKNIREMFLVYFEDLNPTVKNDNTYLGSLLKNFVENLTVAKVYQTTEEVTQTEEDILMSDLTVVVPRDRKEVFFVTSTQKTSFPTDEIYNTQELLKDLGKLNEFSTNISLGIPVSTTGDNFANATISSNVVNAQIRQMDNEYKANMLAEAVAKQPPDDWNISHDNLLDPNMAKMLADAAAKQPPDDWDISHDRLPGISDIKKIEYPNLIGENNDAPLLPPKQIATAPPMTPLSADEIKRIETNKSLAKTKQTIINWVTIFYQAQSIPALNNLGNCRDHFYWFLKENIPWLKSMEIKEIDDALNDLGLKNHLSQIFHSVKAQKEGL